MGKTKYTGVMEVCALRSALVICFPSYLLSVFLLNEQIVGLQIYV